MKLVGLAAPMRCGKDTIADYLVAQHDFLKVSFSDALYREVQEAYGLPDQSLLRNVETKEVVTECLALKHCKDTNFVEIAISVMDKEAEWHVVDKYLLPTGVPLSPRWVLQQWGTAYRREQDPDYWLKRADDFITVFFQQRYAAESKEPEQRTDLDNEVLRVQGLVNASARFKNECDFIRYKGGEIWHIYRREAEAKHLDSYVSEQRLPVAETDRELFNNSTIEKLQTAASILLTTSVRRMVLES